LDELARFYLADRHEIIVLKETSGVLGIYDFRRINLRKFIKLYFSLIELRRTIKKIHGPILLDDQSIRNKIAFLGIKKEYLLKNKNIYESYGSFFSCEPTKLRSSPTPDSIAVFPFGSTSSKTAGIREIENILTKNGLSNNNVVVYVHVSDAHRIEEQNQFSVVILKTITEIIEVVMQAETIISVDTFQLHLAELYDKKIIIAGVVNKNFIPNSIKD